MSKILKLVLITAYSALFVHYLKITLTGRSNDSIELEYVLRKPGSLKKIMNEIKKYGANLTLRKLTLNFKRPERLPTDFKYILQWTEAFSHYTFSIFPNGQTAFVENNCEFENCFMTNDKSLLPDRRYFDAIVFDVENNWDAHPIIRAPHQYYIFAAAESASNYPMCHPSFDSYYNLTWTYKLDSDIRWSHITILDKFDKFVGPEVNMKWITPMKPTSETVVRRLVHKKKVAAWFVSNCRSKSKREKVATSLSAALAKYNLKIDIFGYCGELSCPKDHMEDCLDLLEQDYYFYLAFENSLSEDYVTEKLLYPLRHFAVPVVYGGANYSRYGQLLIFINSQVIKFVVLKYFMSWLYFFHTKCKNNVR